MRRLVVPIGALALLAGCTREPEPVVRARPEYYAHSIAAIGVPGARRSFQIGSGSCVATGDVAITWSLEHADSVQVSPVSFEADAVPVAHWTMSTPDLTVFFEAAAAPVPGLGDTSCLLSVRVDATRRRASSTPVRLVARVTRAPAGPSFVPWDAERSALPLAWNHRWVVAGERLVVLGPLRARHDSLRGQGDEPGALSTILNLPDHGAAPVGVFLVPAYSIDVRLRERVQNLHHDAIAKRARSLWREWLSQAAPLELPDTLIRDGYRAALVTLLLCQERQNERWLPIGSPFQYRDLWLRDGVRTVRALAVSGLTRVAYDDMTSLLRFEMPNGAFLSQMGQIDGTGQALWGMEQIASRPPSRERSRGFMGPASEGLRYLSLERQRTRIPGAEWGGLMGYANPRDNEMVRAQLTGNDAWSFAGLRAAEQLASRAGDVAVEREAERLSRGFRASILDALSRTHARDIPPSWQGVGRDWGNLTFGSPSMAVDAMDPRMHALAERLWAERGPGLVSWGHPDSLHSYLGTDVAQWALQVHRDDWAYRYLVDLLGHSSSTLGQAEVFSASTRGFGTNLPPHATAAAMLVDLVRNMIVQDDGDTLEVAMGASEAWWRGTRFGPAPTRFGTTKIALSRDADDRWRATWDPLASPIRVWVPFGWRIESVEGGSSISPRCAIVDGKAGSLELRVRKEP